MIRVRATEAAPSSNIREIAVPGVGDVFPSGLALDTRNETVTGVSNLMEFSTNGTTWTTIAVNPMNITNLIPAATSSQDVMLSIRYREANGNPASIAVTLVIPRRPAAPAPSAVRFDGPTESILATAALEFRAGTAGSFTPVPSGDTRIPVIIGTTSQIYQMRFRATDTAFMSATLSVTVPVRATAPNAVFNSTQNAITGVTNAMEYSLNGDTWTTVTGTSIPRSVIGNAARTVQVRIRATTAAPASNIREVAVPNA